MSMSTHPLHFDLIAIQQVVKSLTILEYKMYSMLTSLPSIKLGEVNVANCMVFIGPV